MTTQIPTIKDNVKIRKEEFGGLIFTNRTPILSINEDSYLILEAINGERSKQDIFSFLQQAYPERLIDESVIGNYLHALEELDLIQWIPHND